MPELPEVETVRRMLIPLTVGKTIQDIKVFWPNIIKRPDDVAMFAEMLKGQSIRTVERRGKFLKFVLTEHVLISHLRMEGRYLLQTTGMPVEPHTHVIFQFTDGTELRYRDVRKFGTMHVFRIGEEDEHLPLSQLGPEPFSPSFTPELLMTKLQKNESKNKKCAS